LRYCGIDVSARPGNQQLVTLHERRSADGLELIATFYGPGSAEQIARTIEGFGRGQSVVGVDAPSGHRLDLLAAGSPVRAAIGVPEGRYERMRVCDALLFRRGLPLYPVPKQGQPQTAWEQWMHVGFEIYAALDAVGPYTPPPAPTYEAPVGDAALAHGALFETYPDAIFCSLLGHRPSPKRTPWGLQQRIAALKQKGVVDEDGGLWHRTLDELDACAAAYAAYALAAGHGTWVGDPQEGVIVLPTSELLDRYDKLPPPSRQALVGT
jgi:predicted nuclease with RNAse H fold